MRSKSVVVFIVIVTILLSLAFCRTVFSIPITILPAVEVRPIKGSIVYNLMQEFNADKVAVTFNTKGGVATFYQGEKLVSLSYDMVSAMNAYKYFAAVILPPFVNRVLDVAGKTFPGAVVKTNFNWTTLFFYKVIPIEMKITFNSY